MSRTINNLTQAIKKEDIIEVDNLDELIALDVSYKRYVEEK